MIESTGDAASTLTYADRVRACFVGKNIGGTLGMPFEGVGHALDLDYYLPVPQKAVANDDLDLQLLWLVMAEKVGPGLGQNDFAQAWLDYQKFTPDEYGVALWNMRRGIMPPKSGRNGNWFKHGMGAAIRSEIWACLMPGQPEIAGYYAAMDASVDHADEGVWAEVFMAGMQSAAFGGKGLKAAIAAGVELIPSESLIAEMIQSVLRLHGNELLPKNALKIINSQWASHNFTDCIMNVAYILFGLLWGEGDFSKTVLLAVNCGQDTDCTGATAGAMFGILHGGEAVPTRWEEPIGETVVASDYLSELDLPQQLDDLTERVVSLSEKFQCYWAGRSYESQLLDEVLRYDNVNDPREYLVCAHDLEDMGLDAPEIVCESDKKHCMDFHGMVVRIPSFADQGTSAAYIQTVIELDEDIEGMLMVCAEAGITAWLDGEMILNYHGRRKIIPAFHRVEGGGVVAVDLKAGRKHVLQVRLIGHVKETELAINIADKGGNMVTAQRYRGQP
ncbi:ADP-ribosylglycohydrolase family protein [Poriferisphaera sp. WC338]|uniref:ADP-ribosylglycohydrolase family protein n=1 Tax=Poriferisphaera sp. WC338 TaxID=3425129 RepID=UPI003D819E93